MCYTNTASLLARLITPFFLFFNIGIKIAALLKGSMRKVFTVLCCCSCLEAFAFIITASEEKRNIGETK